MNKRDFKMNKKKKKTSCSTDRENWVENDSSKNLNRNPIARQQNESNYKTKVE